MQAIWHDNIATYCDVVYRIRACCKFKERGIRGIENFRRWCEQNVTKNNGLLP